MRFCVGEGLVALMVCAGAARAEPVSEQGYLIDCRGNGEVSACTIGAAGFIFRAGDGEGTPVAVMDQLWNLPPMSAIRFDGEMSNMGDSTADIVLSRVSRVDDINEGNMQYLQGDWRPEGEETPFHIVIEGLTWSEYTQDDPGEAFGITAGQTCADGVVPEGTALSLYQLGGDPEARGCWQIEYIDDKTLVLRDFMGEQGQVTYDRISEFTAP